MAPAELVVKVGGSLFDLPDLGSRLRQWLQTEAAPATVLVPGGGPTADAVRVLDRCHQLGEERSHWLALRAMGLNAHFLAGLLPGSRVVGDVAVDDRAADVRVLDAHRFARADECRPGHLPHCWGVTSDAIAARAAVVAGARQLVLLKSIDIPEAICWAGAARRGFVDPFFAEVVGSGIEVRAINFRTWRR